MLNLTYILVIIVGILLMTFNKFINKIESNIHNATGAKLFKNKQFKLFPDSLYGITVFIIGFIFFAIGFLFLLGVLPTPWANGQH
jgi:hypothetical protein